jgi:Domain of unknown function (DUF6851)/VCPO second helical-bundle domain
MNTDPRAAGRRAILVVCALVSLVATTQAAADPNVAVRWNDAMLQAVRNTNFAPMFAARALAIVHTSMYDAWAAYDPVAVGTQFGGTLRRPEIEQTLANKERATSYAAYRSLVDLFPTQLALFDALMAELGFDPADTSTDPTTPTGIGNITSAAVIAFRHGDGSNQLGDENGGAPYSDYTGYVPVNTPDQIVDPNRWQPLLNPNGSVQTFLAPHWGLVIPFALGEAGQFRPEAPPLFPLGTYRKEANQILHISADLTDEDKVIATYWADGPSTETPPGHWNLFARFVSERDAHTLDQDVKMFFALGNALLDSSIAVWECKRFYDYVRPITAVRFLYAGKPVRAWAGPYQGTQVIPGETFKSYIGTPPFAEYVSGHSTFSAASAEILKSVAGSDTFGASVTIAAGSTPVEPGAVPAQDVTLAWATFSDAADQAGMSRRFGGIHFESGDLQARALGRLVGTLAWEKAGTYFDGTAAR